MAVLAIGRLCFASTGAAADEARRGSERVHLQCSAVQQGPKRPATARAFHVGAESQGQVRDALVPTELKLNEPSLGEGVIWDPDVRKSHKRDF
ncbi:hypothetical protein CGMCC3_g1369 [Colletotrichum fructicola]|nr:uncharacterized protein CGMCC3_g1369 [Colletotrichum fructicola]KAE9582466.1 hypothetical protein CGMCC3_g1369 [Colletotrichum fructicola]